jgi:1-acyl-sn-glycerol-3-phosphate acyltransferase
MASAREPRFWHRLYALWAWPIFLPFFIVETFVFGSVAWIVSHVSPNAATHVARTWCRVAMWANFTRVEASGAERIVPGRSYVIMANHASLADIVAIGAALPIQFRFVMKAELRRVPVFGAACAKWGCVYVAREDRARAIASLQGAGPLLQQGASLIVFPEGTRSADGTLGPFKKGGFMVALSLGIDILPVSILGSAVVLPPRSFSLLPGRIRVVVKEPIPTQRFGLERRDELMAEVRRAIDPDAA